MPGPVIDLSPGPRPYSVEVRWGTAYELAVSIGAYLDDHPQLELNADWRRQVEHRLPREIAQELRHWNTKVAPLESVWLLAFYWQLTEASMVIERLAATKPREFHRFALWLYTEQAPEVVDAALAGDSGPFLAAIPEEMRHYARESLAMDPEIYHRSLLRVLQGWYDAAIRPEESWLTPLLRRDAAAKADLLKIHPPVQVVELATGGIHQPPDRGIDRVLLVPQYHMRPYNVVSMAGKTKLFIYPVADEHLEEAGDKPPVSLVRLLKALADENRLRLLKLLQDGEPHTLADLTDRMALAKSTLHHHLVALRAAGLVRISEPAGTYMKHQSAGKLADLLSAYLGEGEKN